MSKRCTKCGEVKDAICFRQMQGRLHSWCRECCNKERKKYKLSNGRPAHNRYKRKANAKTRSHAHNHYRRWSEREDNFIRDNPHLTNRQISEAIGRTLTAVFHRRHSLGLAREELKTSSKSP